MTVNQMVDAILDRMSPDEQTLLAWLSKNHAEHRLTHMWFRVARWAIEYRDHNGVTRRKKPLSLEQFTRIRREIDADMFCTAQSNIEVIKIQHREHVYIYTYGSQDIGILVETLHTQVERPRSWLSIAIADRIFREAVQRDEARDLFS